MSGYRHATALLTCWTLAACTQAPAPAPPPAQAIAETAATAATPVAVPLEDTIARLERQADAWDKAIVAKERAGIVGNMAEPFVQIDSGGSVYSGPQFVDDLMSDKLSIDPYTVEELQVRIYGETALLTGKVDMRGTYDGEPFRSHFRYTDVYVRQGDAWKVSNVQITRIAD